MNILIFILICDAAWALGVIAFCQIIGSIRVRSHLFAIILWSAIVISVSLLVYHLLFDYIWAYVIGLATSFIKILLTPNIE